MSTEEVEVKHTIVDAFVKKAMLRHFTLFPTRMHVLVNLFFTIGTGHYWVEDETGFAVPLSSIRDDSPMGIKTHEEDYPSRGNHECMGEAWSKADAADAEFQNLVRDWARRNIDVIVTRDFHFYDFRLPEPEPYSCCGSGSLLDSFPLNTHPDWLNAIDEVCDYVLVLINKRTMIHGIKDENARIEVLNGRHRQYFEPYRLAKRAAAKYRKLPLFIEREEVAQKLIAEMLNEVKQDLGVV